mmetsp:Transcript_8918/g.13391  ORF Transcript_8918/g.13391 Transcript_8918/m.13391 type:complete len:889 (-) Transcript_8918:131-2797(-)
MTTSPFFSLFVLLQALLFQRISSYQSRFTGHFTDDSIAYTSITVPDKATRISLYIWADPLKHTPTYVLLGADRVPTIDDYDAVFTLPYGGEVLELVDNTPSKSVLYIGIWGGVMLHSYRYFGGSPVYYSTAVISEIVTCDSVYQRGPSCVPVPPLHHNSLTSIATYLGERTSRILYIPNGIENVILTASVTLSSDMMKDICSQISHTIRLAVFLFLESSSDMLDNALETDIKNISNLCSRIEQSHLFVEVELVRPTVGYWTFQSDVTVGHCANVTQVGNLASPTARELKKGVSNCLFADTDSLKDHFKISRGCGEDHSLAAEYAVESIDTVNSSIRSGFSIDVFTNLYSCPAGYTKTQEVVGASASDIHRCILQVREMYRTTSQDTATTQFSLSGPSSRIISTNNPVQNTGFESYAVFRGDLSGLRFDPAGGVMIVRLSSASTDGIDSEPNAVFSVLLRYGGVPNEDTMTQLTENYYSRLASHPKQSMVSPNLYMLSSDDTHVMWRKTKVYAESTERVGIQYTWIMDKPRLTIINPGESLYVRVSVSDSNTDDITAEYDLKIKVFFAMCADRSHCVHGDCVVQNGDVVVSSCSCRYPWAGERCDELAESFGFYIFKVCILVLSNCAAVPSVMLAIKYNLPVVAATLFCAGLSSGLYHLCDSDLYCIGGLSFSALQICDVLFATSSMAAIAIHHCPWSTDRRSAAALVLLAFLVSPVSNSPTNAVVIILAISLSIIVVILSWVGIYLPYSCIYKRLSRQDENGDSHIELTETSISSPTTSLEENDTETSEAESLLPTDSSAVGSPLSTGEYDDRTSSSCCREFGLTIAGIVMVVLAFACYVGQNRTNYWISHSLWHTLAMGSTYCFIQNRDRAVNRMHSYHTPFAVQRR